MSDTLEADAPEADAPASSTDQTPAAADNSASGDDSTGSGSDAAPASGTAAAPDGDAAPALPQEHLDWTSQFCGMTVDQSGAAAADQAGGDDATGDGSSAADASAAQADGGGDAQAGTESGATDGAAAADQAGGDDATGDGSAAADASAGQADGSGDAQAGTEAGATDGASAADQAGGDDGTGDGSPDADATAEQPDGGGTTADNADADGADATRAADATSDSATTEDTAKQPDDDTTGGSGTPDGQQPADNSGTLWDKAKDFGGKVVDAHNSAVQAVADWATNGRSSAEAMPPLAKGDVGDPQQARADQMMSKMSEEDQKKVQDVLDTASPEERNYLVKALASNHSADEIADFAQKIQFQDPKWMDQQLHLVGGSDGKGIKQQWKDSCGPTTAEAMKGEMDPMYALKMHEDNPDVTKADDKDGTAANPSMAADQQSDLQNGGGSAGPRDGSAGGKGMGIDNLLQKQTDQTGVSFDCQNVRTDPDALNKGLNQAEVALKSGMPVPVRVSDPTDKTNQGHFVLMTGVDDGPPRTYNFHDPWQGQTMSYTEDQIKNKQMQLGIGKQITHMWQPSIKGT